jgi:O-antigen/teichoic acid export membrane protein
VLLPAFSRAFSDKELSSKIGKIYNSSIYYTLLFLLPILVYAVSASTPLLYALFSSKYSLAPLFFALIAIGSAIGMLNTYASNLQVSYGDTKLFMYYQFAAVAIQVALLFILTPLFSAIGAILALFVISQIVINVIYIRALYKQFSLKHSFGQVARLAMPAAILMIGLYFVTLALHNSAWALLTNLIATILLFPPMVALFGGIRANDLKFIKEIANSFRIGKPIGYIVRYTELFVR